MGLGKANVAPPQSGGKRSLFEYEVVDRFPWWVFLSLAARWALVCVSNRNEIVLHGYTKFSFLFNPVLITAGAVRIIGVDYTS